MPVPDRGAMTIIAIYGAPVLTYTQIRVVTLHSGHYIVHSTHTHRVITTKCTMRLQMAHT